MKNIAIALGLVMLAAPTIAAAEKQPELTGLQLQQMQSRDFEVSKGISFPAVMTVLQDAGYRIGSADKDTGLITGIGTSQNKLTWAPFVGFGNSKKNPVVSAYIEDRGPNMSRIRLNFVMTKVSGNQFGMGGNEKPIMDPVTYQQAFEKISQAIFVRQAMDAPVPTSVASALSGPTSASSQPIGYATPEAHTISSASLAGVRLVPAKTPSGFCIIAPPGYAGTGSQSRPAITTATPRCQ